MGPALPSAYLIRVRPNLSQITPWFLFYAFASPGGQAFLGNSATSTTQPNVNANAIRAVPVPRVSLKEQTEIVRRIETAFARIDKMVEEAARAGKLLERLEQQLLAKAFRGELVPQDPNDKPASALLESIRVARAADKKTKPKLRKSKDGKAKKGKAND